LWLRDRWDLAEGGVADALLIVVDVDSVELKDVPAQVQRLQRIHHHRRIPPRLGVKVRGVGEHKRRSFKMVRHEQGVCKSVCGGPGWGSKVDVGCRMAEG